MSAHTATGRSAHTSNALLRKHLARWPDTPGAARGVRHRPAGHRIRTRPAVDPVSGRDPARRRRGGRLPRRASVPREDLLGLAAVPLPHSRSGSPLRRSAGSEFVPVRAAPSLRDLPDLGGGILETAARRGHRPRDHARARPGRCLRRAGQGRRLGRDLALARARGVLRPRCRDRLHAQAGLGHRRCTRRVLPRPAPRAAHGRGCSPGAG